MKNITLTPAHQIGILGAMLYLALNEGAIIISTNSWINDVFVDFGIDKQISTATTVVITTVVGLVFVSLFLYQKR